MLSRNKRLLSGSFLLYNGYMEKEVWKPIPGYEDRYLASSLGRIKSLPSCSRSKGVIIKPNLKKSGYTNTGLCKDGKVKHWRTHRLIALTFLPNPDNLPEVNHLSGVKNDNRVCNLAWCSRSDNVKHKYKVLGYKSKGGVARKPIRCAETGVEYASLRDAERKTGLHRQSLQYCLKHSGEFKGFHWEYID